MIKQLQICPTWACNLKCPTCDCWKRGSDISLSRDQVLSIADSKYFREVNYVTIEGGEPTLYPEISYMANLFASAFGKVSIITNGYNTYNVQKLLESVSDRRDRVRFVVSLNGIGKVHDSTRGKRGVYDRVIETCATMSAKGFEFNLQYLPTHSNIGKSDDIFHIAEFYGVSLNICYPSDLGKFKMRIHDEIFSEYELLKKRQIKNANLKGFRSRWAMECFTDKARRMELMPCSAGRVSLMINPAGLIRPCSVDETMCIGRVTDSKVEMWGAECVLEQIPERCQYQSGSACNQTHIGYALHKMPFYLIKWRIGKWLRLK